MSYQALPYTYGALTEAQIDAIPTSSPKIPEGSTVFNTDTKMLEIYNGRVWMDERCICYKVAAEPGSVLKGNLIATNDANGEVGLATTTYRERFVGVATRASVNGFVPVAHCGRVQAICGDDVDLGRLAKIDSTAGTFDAATSAGGGGIGLAMEAGNEGDLLWIALQTIELS